MQQHDGDFIPPRPSRKRQRQEPQQQHPPHLFLPTHLSLLRALHADDATAAGGDSADSSCPRPSWVEVNNFLLLQASIMNREVKARRTKRVLDALLTGVPATTTTIITAGTTTPAVPPLSRAGIPPSSTGQQHRQRGSRIEESRPLDPRSVVSAVLRRAVRDREVEHVSGSAGLRGLRKGVDDTVDHLASSLDGLRRSRRNRAKPWRSGREEEEQGANSADVVERHANKLLLWLRLQAALTASRVGVDERRSGRRNHC